MFKNIFKHLVLVFCCVMILEGYIYNINNGIIIAESIACLGIVIAHCSDEICEKLSQRIH